MSELTLAQEAMLVWPVLVQAAQMQRVLTYGDVQDFTGIAAVGTHSPLGLIHGYCKSRKQYPVLNAIVVSATTGFPGDGFPENWTEEKHLIERARVFAFNWCAKDKPRPRDFEAVQSAP